jgi:hypothetical protein
MRLDEFLKVHPFDAIEFYRTKSDSLYEAFKKATLTENLPPLVQKKKKKKKKKKKPSTSSDQKDVDQESGADPFFGFCPVHQCNFSFSEKRSHDLSELSVLKRFLPDPVIKIVTGYADFHELDLNPVFEKASVDCLGNLQTDFNSIRTRNLHRFLSTLIKVFAYENHTTYENRIGSLGTSLQLRSLLNPKTGEVSPQAFSDYFVGRLGRNKCLSINFGSKFITCSEERFCSCNVCDLSDLQILFSDVFGREALEYGGNNSLKLPYGPDTGLSDPLGRSFSSIYRRMVGTRIYGNQPFGPFKLKIPIHFESMIYWLDFGSKIESKHPNVSSIRILAIGSDYISYEYDNEYTCEANVRSTIHYLPKEIFGE